MGALPAPGTGVPRGRRQPGRVSRDRDRLQHRDGQGRGRAVLPMRRGDRVIRLFSRAPRGHLLHGAHQPARRAQEPGDAVAPARDPRQPVPGGSPGLDGRSGVPAGKPVAPGDRSLPRGLPGRYRPRRQARNGPSVLRRRPGRRARPGLDRPAGGPAGRELRLCRPCRAGRRRHLAAGHRGPGRPAGRRCRRSDLRLWLDQRTWPGTPERQPSFSGSPYPMPRTWKAP